MPDEPKDNTDSADSTESTTQTNAALSLQQIVEEERSKRIEAENMAQALIEEFSSCSDFDDVRKIFRDKIKEFAPAALINIMSLANSAESESVRASLNKWVVEWAMSDKIDNAGSELGDLLKKLQNQPTGPSSGS